MNDATIADVDAMVAVERARGDETRGEWGVLASAKERVACGERLVTVSSAACIVGPLVHDGGPYASSTAMPKLGKLCVNSFAPSDCGVAIRVRHGVPQFRETERAHAAGMPLAWTHRFAGSSIIARWPSCNWPRKKGGWGRPLPRGSGRGVSLQSAFGTYMAQVAEVEVSKAGEVRVRHIVCAVDCGSVVNPDTVRAQVEGAVIFGISAVLFGEITLKNGRVEQNNFHDYGVLRMNETPAIEVHIVRNNEPPGGMGEPGTSAVMPAVTNAIFAATGKRVRKLPVLIST